MTAARELLDQLDALHAAGTPGTWASYWGDHIGSGVKRMSAGGVQVDYDICEMQDEDDRACTDNEQNPASPSADAALIVGAVNALPQLTAALRGALAVTESAQCHTAAHQKHEIPSCRCIAFGQVRDAITAALSPAHPMSTEPGMSQP